MTGLYPTAEALMAEARAQTGLSDFGTPTFHEGLEQLLASLAADVPYEAEDRTRAIELITRRLANRLKIEAWFKENPAAEGAPIENPVSIVGLPRTGTTALGNMMSLDPRFRPLRPWEQSDPCPPPRIENEADDPRRLTYIAWLGRMFEAQPEQAAMHLWDADATLEDTEILGLEFSAQQMTWPVYGYHAWWRESDMRATFAYHARVSRLLQSHRPPNRWLFKAPHHKFHLDHIVEAYPDIRFIFTHRDPGRSVPSYASFVATLYPPYVRDRIGKKKIGQEIHNHLLTGMRQAVAARERLGPNRFLDVQHTNFIARPMDELKRIYDWLGLPITDLVRAKLEGWLEKNHSGAHGTHRYTAEEYGLSADRVRADYDFYIRAFGVECEPRSDLHE
jgi:Sulfotransferase family